MNPAAPETTAPFHCHGLTRLSIGHNLECSSTNVSPASVRVTVAWRENPLAFLILASAAGFWVRFRPVVRVLSRAQPDAGIRFGSFTSRVKAFIGEVLLQRKVIAQRPAAGIAHALVFWGFCAFALVTIDHIATGFGAPILSRDSGFGRAYFGFAALFAIAVAVSITALAIRRFAEQPVWLGKVSPESGVIAALIFLLMLTYLAGLTLGETSAAAHAMWWAHTLLLLVFLPLIPHTNIFT